jgi:phospholipase C
MQDFSAFETAGLLQSNPERWAETAIFVTVDEGGGMYDSANPSRKSQP